MKRPKIVVWQSPKDDQWYWQLVASNGEVQCQSEGYVKKNNAVRGAKAARRNMFLVTIKVM